jgi:uncharacterized tellurite resistance protein B-like protein
MGISDLFISLEQKRNISHFANIVRIAKSDNKIATEEVEFLTKVSHKYNITDEKFREILRNPEKVSTIAHLDCLERIERLYDLLTMVKADHRVEKEEVSMLRRITTGLAFPLNRVDMVVDRSIEIDVDQVSVEDFSDEILRLLKMK